MKTLRVSKKSLFHVVCFKVKSLKNFDENSYDVLLTTGDKTVAFSALEHYKRLYSSAGSTYILAILVKSYSVSVLC